MKMIRTVFMAALGAMAAARADGADMRPSSLQDLTGELKIEQDLPLSCDNVSLVTPVIQGAMALAPGEDEVWDGAERVFVLTQASFAFAPFSIHRNCVGQDVTRGYSEVGVALGRAVLFRATPAGPSLLSVTIPREDVVLHQAAILNGAPDVSDSHPSEDVTGTIDLGAGTVALRVKVATQIHVDLLGDYDGMLTADLAGRIVVPDFDQDGVSNNRDNCKLVPNPTQTPIPTPVLRAPAPLTLSTCLWRDLGMPSATDVCRGGPVSVTHNAPPRFPLATTTVTWRAQDDYGHVVTQPQPVTVVDTAPPTFTSIPGPIALNNCVGANLGTPTGYDDCAGTPVLSNDAPAVFARGTTAVTWTMTDVSGNATRAAGAQLVTVTDTIKPAVTCTGRPDPDDPHAALFRVGASDACTSAPILQLGVYKLTSGEVIKLSPQALPGVAYVGLVGPGQIRWFRVGPNSNVVRAQDAAGNFRTATCTLAGSPF